ncbi:MAG: putative DNA modification/repair radical SAM protein [Halanaerobiaceae bacterium]
MLNLKDKLHILSSAAKYDASCSSSGSNRKNRSGGLGNGAVSGICHSWSDDGRCISLLKILLTNYCVFDCVYCVNRRSNDLPRAAFSPEEVAELTVNFYKRNYIEGLFLSSAVIKSPDYTMELMLRTAQILRDEYKFNGYIHMKAIPGADYDLIRDTGFLVDRMSVNIELPSEESLQKLAPDKDKKSILGPMKKIGQQITENKEERKGNKKKKRPVKQNRNSKHKNQSDKLPQFVPAGHSTQLIIGASPESDYQILRLSESLYQNYNLKRVYYSAFVPVAPSSRLPDLDVPPLLREHRLYQADWLLRFYGFNASELLTEKRANFDIDLDPKANWAINNLDIFPLEINQADYYQLLRVPGIGVKSARRIVSARKTGQISFRDLKKFGTVLKRARYFITCQGKYQAGIPFKKELIVHRLKQGQKGNRKNKKQKQLSLFTGNSQNNIQVKKEQVNNPGSRQKNDKNNYNYINYNNTNNNNINVNTKIKINNKGNIPLLTGSVEGDKK